MTDCELLEFAAKAAGIDWFDEPAAKQGRGLHMKSGRFWNPLTDDGDALRLVATLGIDVEWRADGRVAAYRHANANGDCFTALESSREDRAANVRRAIVRAAAAIGRARWEPVEEGEQK